MKLYELTEMFTELFEQFEDIENYIPDTDEDGNYIDGDGNIINDVVERKEQMFQAWFDTFDGIEGEFDLKAENTAVYIKSLTAMAAVIKNEEANLRAHRQRLDRQARRLKDYLFRSMEAIGRTKIEMPRAMITVRSNPESLVIENEGEFIRWAENNNASLLKYSAPEIRKSEVKKLMKDGAPVPFAHTERSRSLIIK
ncbi:MAG: siphovirus Gp157 family protein [Ruminococcus sp.]|nr:siphovirus Gp157 family protein [Ruminococcus sp.]